jgi:hypothetical protein
LLYFTDRWSLHHQCYGDMALWMKQQVQSSGTGMELIKLSYIAQRAPTAGI